MQDLVGKTLLNRYHVEEFVGRGGMAEVYRARDMRRRITVALKFLRQDMAEDEVFLRRFRREARVLETLQHPNIVRYYDFQESDSLHFLVVEFIRGEGLRKKLSQLSRPLTLSQTLAILEPVCNALHYAHAEGIYHCDIKPANIMMEKSGRVVVSDFGIARVAESATATYSSTGTPAYMAPEQCRGQKVDARTDLYALAIATFEMLTLDRPFTGDTATIQGALSERVRWEQLKAAPPSARKHNPEIPDWADCAILKALEKPRNRRFATVLAFYDALSNGGKAVPDANLPWADASTADPGMTGSSESSTPRSPTQGEPWEQRVTDALWTVRRMLSRASARLTMSIHGLGQLWRSPHPAWLQKVKTVHRKTTNAWSSLNKRTFAYWLVGAMALLVFGFAAWHLSGTKSAPTTNTHIPTSPRTNTPVSGPNATAAATAVPIYLILTAQGGGNLRSGPATTYPVIAAVAPGETFEVLARSLNSDWYQVCCWQGRNGWIHASLADVQGAVNLVPAITPPAPAPQQINATPTGP